LFCCFSLLFKSVPPSSTLHSLHSLPVNYSLVFTLHQAHLLAPLYLATELLAIDVVFNIIASNCNNRLGGVKIAEQGKRMGWRFLDVFWIKPVDLWAF
jgi:hypothetical protein